MEGFDWDFVHTVLKETSVREAVEPLKMTFSCDCSDEKDVLMKFHSRKAPHSTDHCTGESLVARRHSTIPYPVARSASISTPQMQKKSESSLTIPALLRTATDELNHQELVAITEVMKAELERLSKQNHERFYFFRFFSLKNTEDYNIKLLTYIFLIIIINFNFFFFFLSN